MSEKPIQSNGSPKPTASPVLALVLGFLPSAILLAVFTGALNNLQDASQRFVLWTACVLSVICCLVSSARLFKRGTVGAFVGAIILMLLNGCIAFFFGCCASFQF